MTPNATGSVTVTSCGSDFDTVLGFYSGSCNSLAPIDCNDDSGCAAGGSTVVFAAVAGTT